MHGIRACRAHLVHDHATRSREGIWQECVRRRNVPQRPPRVAPTVVPIGNPVVLGQGQVAAQARPAVDRVGWKHQQFRGAFALATAYADGPSTGRSSHALLVTTGTRP